MSNALFPMFTRGAFGDGIALVVEVLVGIGFGFALERSGFARSENLVSIFYGRDFRVMRVMFTAILTAMAGLVILAGAGVMDMGLLYINETFLWPQLVGGLMLGAGFVISGYCPGTSLVGAASGRIDALFVLAGVALGTSVYAEVLPAIKPFVMSGSMGTASLPSVSGLPAWAVAAGVFGFAAGAFLAVGRIEKWVRRRFMHTDEPAPGPEPIRLDPRRTAPHHVLFAAGLALVVALGIMLSTRSRPADWGRYVGVDEHPTKGEILPALEPLDLARMIIEGRIDLAVVDVRDGKPARSVPGATFMTPDDVRSRAASHALPPADLYVILDRHGESMARDLCAALAGHGQDSTWVDGGLEGWMEDVMSPPVPPAAGLRPSEIAAFTERSQIHAFFANAKAAPPPKAAPAMQVAPKKRKGGGCS